MSVLYPRASEVQEAPAKKNGGVEWLRKGVRHAVFGATFAAATVGVVQGHKHMSEQKQTAFREGGYRVNPEDLGDASLLAICLKDSKKPDASRACFHAGYSLATMLEAEGKESLLELYEDVRKRFKDEPDDFGYFVASISQRLAKPLDSLAKTPSAHRTARNNPDFGVAFRMVVASIIHCRDKIRDPNLSPKEYDKWVGAMIGLLTPVQYFDIDSTDHDEMCSVLESIKVQGALAIEFEIARQCFLHADTITSDDIAAIRSGSFGGHQASGLTE